MSDLTISSSESEASSGQESISCESVVMVAAPCSTEQSASLSRRSLGENTGLARSSVDKSSMLQRPHMGSSTASLSDRSDTRTKEAFLSSNVHQIGVSRQQKLQRANKAPKDGHSKDTDAKKIRSSPSTEAKAEAEFEAWLDSIILFPLKLPIDPLTRFIPIGIGCWILASSALYVLTLIATPNRDPIHLYRATIIPSPLIASFYAVKLVPRVKGPELQEFLCHILFITAGVYILTYLVFVFILVVKLYGRWLSLCVSLVS